MKIVVKYTSIFIVIFYVRHSLRKIPFERTCRHKRFQFVEAGMIVDDK